MRVDDLAALVEGVEKFKEYRNRTYKRYFAIEEAINAEDKPSPERMLDLKAQYERLEYLTDVLDCILYGLLGETDDKDGSKP